MWWIFGGFGQVPGLWTPPYHHPNNRRFALYIPLPKQSLQTCGHTHRQTDGSNFLMITSDKRDEYLELYSLFLYLILTLKHCHILHLNREGGRHIQLSSKCVAVSIIPESSTRWARYDLFIHICLLQLNN